MHSCPRSWLPLAHELPSTSISFTGDDLGRGVLLAGALVEDAVDVLRDAEERHCLDVTVRVQGSHGSFGLERVEVRELRAALARHAERHLRAD